MKGQRQKVRSKNLTAKNIQVAHIMYKGRTATFLFGLLLAIFLFGILTLDSISSSEIEHKVILGKDDLTGKDIELTIGKKHPFVAWTAEEISSFKIRLLSQDKMHAGAHQLWKNYSWGTLAKAAKGEPLACAQEWQVTRNLNMAKKAAEYLLKKSSAYDEKKFLTNEQETLADLYTCTLVYDLIADSEVLTAAENERIHDYLKNGLYALKKLQYFGMIHNIGTGIDLNAWAAALCLEDVEMLKELFQRFKVTVGKGLLPGGYWYEGTAYGRAVAGNIKGIIEKAARSGIDLAHLHCKREPLSPQWNVREGYVQAGEIFEWPFRVVTPFMEIPNIADGDKPDKLSTISALTVGKYTKSQGFLNSFYILDLGMHKSSDPHTWGDFPPNPDVPPLDRLGDTVYPETGMFIFRQGTGLDPDDQYVLFLTLPRTGFHMHSDQGHISIARYGRWLTGDIESSAKSTGYQNLRNDFSATRWAHNTVVIGGRWGKTDIDFPKVNYLSYEPSRLKVADVTMTDVTNGPVTTHRRCVLVTDDFIVVADDLIASEPTTFDWFFHGVNNAAWSFEKTGNKRIDAFITYIPEHSVPDYDFVWDETYETITPWNGQFLVDEKGRVGLKVWHLDAKGGRACSGHFTPPKHGDPGLYEGERMYLICERKAGKEAHFTAVLEPFKWDTKIEDIQLLENTPAKRKLKITYKDKTVQVVSVGNGEYSVK